MSANMEQKWSLTNKQGVSLSLVLSNIFIAFLGIGLVVPVMPSYMKQLQLNGEVMGYLFSVFAFAQLIFSPITGVWVDKVGRKKMMVLGLLLFSFAEFLFGIGNGVGMLFTSRILAGFSAACIMPAVTAFIADITTMEQRPKAFGFLSAAISGGYIIGPGIGGFIADFGLRVPFFFASAIGLMAAILSLTILKEPLSAAKRNEMIASKIKTSFMQEMKKSFQPLYFVPFIIVFILAFGLSSYEMMLGLFVSNKFGFTPKEISGIITVSGVLGVVVQVIFFNKLVKTFGEIKLIQANFALAAVFIFLSIFVEGFWIISAVTFVVFLTCGLLRPAVTSMLSTLAADKDQGFVAGMNSTYTSLGNIIGPALAGILIDLNINLPYSLAAFVLLSGFAVSFMLGAKK